MAGNGERASRGMLPAAAATSALSGTPEMHKTALRFVVNAFLCDNRLPAGRC
jgi:hypothetical protein